MPTLTQASAGRRREVAGPQHAILAAGERLPQSLLQERWDSPEVQRLLFAARARFGHALCTCRPQPLKLQIRLRASRCHLAVWPLQHADHDRECLFFHELLATASPAQEPAAAVRSTARPTQRESPGSERPTRTALWLGGAGSAPAAASTVSARTLALRLWQEGALCRWHPTWTRDWGRSRYQLLQAATGYTLQGCPLEHLLFIPRPFRSELRLALDQQWDSFLRGMHLGAQGTPSLLLAPLRALRPASAQQPATVWLRHLRAPVALRPGCWDFLLRTCGAAVAESRIGSEPRPYDTGFARSNSPALVGLFVVERHGGGLWARAAWLLAVHPRAHVPAGTRDAVRLLDALHAGGHAFEHLPAGPARGASAAPELLVRHVLGPDGAPVARAALVVVRDPAAAASLAALMARAEQLAALGIPTWWWKPAAADDDACLPLPPPAHLGELPARAQLQRIAADSGVDYVLGPSRKLLLLQAPAEPTQD